MQFNLAAFELYTNGLMSVKTAVSGSWLPKHCLGPRHIAVHSLAGSPSLAFSPPLKPRMFALPSLLSKSLLSSHSTCQQHLIQLSLPFLSKHFSHLTSGHPVSSIAQPLNAGSASSFHLPPPSTSHPFTPTHGSRNSHLQSSSLNTRLIYPLPIQ